MRLTFIHNGNDAFLEPLVRAFRSEYEVKSIRPHTENELRNALENTDIAWYEWCDQLAAAGTKYRMKCHQVCRLHSYEMFTEVPRSIKWHRLDRVIFVSGLVRDYCIEKFSIPVDRATTIRNGVDVEKFNIPENKEYEKRVAFVGYLNYKKGPMLLLQTLRAIHDYDPSFTFHIAGEFQDERVALYMRTFLGKASFGINFDGWQADMPAYLADKDYVISTSMFESFHFSIAEGMACGLIPIIHDWPGATELYPGDNVFTYPDQAVKIIKTFEGESVFNQRGCRNAMRQYIVDYFSLDNQIERVGALLREIVND